MASVLYADDYEGKEITDKAAFHCQKALEINPNLALAYYLLGLIYNRKVNELREIAPSQEKEIKDKAIYYFEKFIKLKGTSKAKYFQEKVKRANKKLEALKGNKSSSEDSLILP